MITELDIGDGNSLFAVFDGHGGEHIAIYVKKHFIEFLLANKNYKKGNYMLSLEEVCLKLDQSLL